jgi:hypothetical protein
MPDGLLACHVFNSAPVPDRIDAINWYSHQNAAGRPGDYLVPEGERPSLDPLTPCLSGLEEALTRGIACVCRVCLSYSFPFEFRKRTGRFSCCHVLYCIIVPVDKERAH